MVGEGVLHEALKDPNVASVLIMNRKPLGLEHPKLKEVLHSNFHDLLPIQEQLTGYDACLFCLGTTSVGKSADDYYHTTYTLTMNVAKTLSRLNPGMRFCYVSGAGTDSSEKGRSRWARVKGKTENDLMNLPFEAVYNFRPGLIKPIPGLKNIHSFYTYINWMFPIGRALSPGWFCTLKELSEAMLYLVSSDEKSQVAEGRDIIRLAAEYRQQKTFKTDSP